MDKVPYYDDAFYVIFGFSLVIQVDHNKLRFHERKCEKQRNPKEGVARTKSLWIYPNVKQNSCTSMKKHIPEKYLMDQQYYASNR